MTTITTEALAGVIRTAAVKAESTEERRVLNFAADQFERINSDVARLIRELEESTSKANRLRRTAKELQEENQQLRTEPFPRDYFAAKALEGDWSAQDENAGHWEDPLPEVLEARAKVYYRMADAMMKVREGKA